MKNIKNIIDTKQVTLNSLEEQKTILQNNMANPSDIHNNAEQINNERRAIDLLKDATELAKENNTENESAKKILENLVEELIEAKEDAEYMQDDGYIAENSDVIPTLNKDLDILTNIINNDISNSSTLQSGSSNDSPESSNNPPANAGVSKQDSSDITSDNTELPDYFDPGDF